MKQASIIPLLKFQNHTLPFKIQTIQCFAEEQDDINEIPHSHDYYEMIWLIKGRGTLYVDMQEHTIESNTVFYLKPNQAHQFLAQAEMEGFVFSFTDSFFKMDQYDLDWECQAKLCELYAERRTISIAHEMEEDMKEVALKIVKEFQNQYSYSTELLKRYFKIFLIYLTRTTEEKQQSIEYSRDTELVKDFMALVEKSFKEKKMVAEYAAQLSVTPNHLNRITKNLTGLSAGHHIRQRVVLEAKRMSRYSGAGMKEIAYNLGFIDTSHFSKFFKAFAGIKFSAFKKGGVVVPFESLNRA